jgi:hypothetical protein
MDLGEAAAQRCIVLHFAQHVHQEHELPIAGAGDQRELGVARVLDDEPRIFEVASAAHALEVRLPALPIRRIREHEIELPSRKPILGESGV